MSVSEKNLSELSIPRRMSLNPLSYFGWLSEQRHWAFLLIGPSLLLVLIVVIYPVIAGILLSFQEVRLNRPNLTGFVGLTHYVELFADPTFQRALWNTVIWVTMGTIMQFCLGLITALALNRPVRGMKLARTVVLLPWFLPSVVAGNMWALMLDFRLGVINDLLVRLGFIADYKAWFASPETAFPALLVVALWQNFPFFALLLLAGLQSISEDLYEAAAVDGANYWQRFRHITLPLLKPVTVAVVVLRVIGMVNSPDLVLILTEGGPGHSTELLSIYAFSTAYERFDFGYAGAQSVIMLILLMIFTIIYIRVSGVTRE